MYIFILISVDESAVILGYYIFQCCYEVLIWLIELILLHNIISRVFLFTCFWYISRHNFILLQLQCQSRKFFTILYFLSDNQSSLFVIESKRNQLSGKILYSLLLLRQKSGSKFYRLVASMEWLLLPTASCFFDN